MHQTASIQFSNLTFSWPDGTTLIDEISGVFGTGRTGMIGANGTGKTTLLRLLAGRLRPSHGTVTTHGTVGYLPQHLTLNATATVADLLGITPRLKALAAIAHGATDPAYFEAVGDDWDIEATTTAAMAAHGLADMALTRRVRTLSGGETTLTALIGLQLGRYETVLLDEPTNNLDRQSRALLYDMMRQWRGTLLVASHDVQLLDLMDDTAELRAGELTVFGGHYTAYRNYLEEQQAAAHQDLRTAQQQLQTEKRQRIAAETKLARRKRFANTAYETKREPKMVMNLRKQAAQVSAGKLRGQASQKVTEAQTTLDHAAAQVRRDQHVRIHLPDPDVPSTRKLVEFYQPHGDSIMVQGPERVALTGRNGVGKSRLLETIFSTARPTVLQDPWAVAATDRIGYLPQRLDHLDDHVSILEAVKSVTLDASDEYIRAQLARFLFRADAVHQRIRELSGGERFRVALAQLLCADPVHQMIILDEPTNNLDLSTVDALVSALEAYRGGLIVVSHDDAFLARLGISLWLQLEETGTAHRRVVWCGNAKVSVPGIRVKRVHPVSTQEG